MTGDDQQALKVALVQGCMPERRDLIETFDARGLALFINGLTFDYGVPSQLETWRYLAKVMALRALDYIWRVDGVEPNPCLDPINSDCSCPHCEAASAAEVATNDDLRAAMWAARADARDGACSQYEADCRVDAAKQELEARH